MRLGRLVPAAAAAASLIFATPAWSGLTFEEACELLGPFFMTATTTELFTGPEVLNHLPGPTAQDFGDMRIGTADDAIHPGATTPPQPGFPPIFGCPNNLNLGPPFEGDCDRGCSNAGESCLTDASCTDCPTGQGCDLPPVCGVPGAPFTKLLEGTNSINSRESNLHGPGSDQLSLAKPGHGAYSFVISTVGTFDSLTYLAGAIVAALSGFEGGIAQLVTANVTLGGTAQVPGVFFEGPLNADLITVGPGDDLAFRDAKADEMGESIVRGCNGLAPGVDGVSDWRPGDDLLSPRFPQLGLTHANKGLWDLRSNPEEGGRLISTMADTVVKIPSSQNFYTTQETPFNGYLFPIDEAEALLTTAFRDLPPEKLVHLPDIPDGEGGFFPDSGKNLAAYFVNVLVPKAEENPENKLVGFFRGKTTLTIIGVVTTLDITVVGAGNFIEYDLCTMEAHPCTF
jgi:hypothetical protein